MATMMLSTERYVGDVNPLFLTPRSSQYGRHCARPSNTIDLVRVSILEHVYQFNNMCHTLASRKPYIRQPIKEVKT
ncbi:unnamed protein product [Euphydryas editha]|uniref:Uncharacterized protein n=1 Tax=Euphydryas editha TaxID=104508 RepID=A0AAU9V154_EUPED|nr:unnamed protein product [Euphydryas editha]